MKFVLVLVLLLAGCTSVSANPPPCHGQVCPSPGPVAMGRLATSGGETGDTTIEGFAFAGAGTGDFSTSVVRTGTRSIHTRLSIGGGAAYAQWNFTGVLGRTYFVRAYIYFTSLPTSSGSPLSIVSFNRAAFPTEEQAGIRVATDGTVSLSRAGSIIGSSAAGLVTTGSWYRFELSTVVGSGSVDGAEARVDDASIASISGQAWTDTALGVLNVGAISSDGGATQFDYYIDDVAFNDDQGTNQNTWPGAGAEVLLLPITDNAVGTGWTLGTGTAFGGNGFGSVDNTPPTGVADLAAGSDPKQIRNANSTANTSYDANLTTYTNAGIGAGSTINVLDPIVATAAPVTTSSKQGTVGVASNPTIANIALGAGGTAGAFWSGSAAAGYPGGWKISHGTLTYAPSVTLGTSPVMRITQVTASTRIAMVCFMGMYVDYTPAVASQVPYVNPMPPLIAQ